MTSKHADLPITETLENGALCDGFRDGLSAITRFRDGSVMVPPNCRLARQVSHHKSRDRCCDSAAPGSGGVPLSHHHTPYKGVMA